MAERTRPNPVDPGDAEIQHAWDVWQRMLVHAGHSEVARQQAREWREMYLALLARRDQSQTAPEPELPEGMITRLAEALARLGELADAGGVLSGQPARIERWLRTGQARAATPEGGNDVPRTG